jgi:hypothetical protein
MMMYRGSGLLLSGLLIAGCSTARFKDVDGKRLDLSGYNCIAVQPVEVVPGINRLSLAEDLGAQIQDRLRQAERWQLATDESEPASATKDRQIDLIVTVAKAKYPSRSKSIWLGSAHKMTCRLQVRDHATGDVLGGAKVSATVEPLMGNAALLNFGWIGILGRTAFDRRDHDAASLHEHIAKEIVQVLNRAKK